MNPSTAMTTPGPAAYAGRKSRPIHRVEGLRLFDGTRHVLRTGCTYEEACYTAWLNRWQYDRVEILESTERRTASWSKPLWS